MLPSSTSPRSKPPYLQDQPALGHALLAAVQLLDILTVQVHHQLLGVAADQDQPALGHALLAAVQLLDPTHPLLQADDADSLAISISVVQLLFLWVPAILRSCCYSSCHGFCGSYWEGNYCGTACLRGENELKYFVI